MRRGRRKRRELGHAWLRHDLNSSNLLGGLFNCHCGPILNSSDMQSLVTVHNGDWAMELTPSSSLSRLLSTSRFLLLAPLLLLLLPHLYPLGSSLPDSRDRPLFFLSSPVSVLNHTKKAPDRRTGTVPKGSAWKTLTWFPVLFFSRGSSSRFASLIRWLIINYAHNGNQRWRGWNRCKLNKVATLI